MDPYSLFSLILAGTNASLCFVVLFGKSKGKTFALTLFGASIWALSLVLVYGEYQVSSENLIYMARMAFVGAALIMAGLVVFERSYIAKKPLRPYWVIIGIIGLIGLVSSPLIVSSLRLVRGQVVVQYGFGYPIFGITFVLVSVLFLTSIIRAYRNARSKTRRYQLRMFLIGMGFSLLVGTFTNLIFPLVFQIVSFSRYGAFSLIFFTTFGTYAILKHHLFNIKIAFFEILLIGLGAIQVSYILSSRNVLLVVINLFSFIVFFWLSRALIKEFMRTSRQELVLMKTTHDLQKTIESKDIFLRMTSHQLRTPLTSLNGFITMMLDQWQDRYKMNQRARTDLLTVYLNAQRLSAVVNDILSVNAINAGRFGLSSQRVIDLKEEIIYLIEDKNYFIEHYNIKFVIKGRGDFRAEVDPMRIREVFNHLINNAIFYGKDKVWVILVDEGDFVSITVRDNGIGLDLEALSHLWEKAWRSKEAYKVNPNGSGMGLFISKVIVELHGGSMTGQSKGLGKGATFSVRLPK